ncbi:MAG: AMP-binding protein [Bacteroidia bacterium]
MTENSAYSFTNPAQCQCLWLNGKGLRSGCKNQRRRRNPDRSAANMVEYFKEPEKTAEALDDEGYLHTGDCGEIDAHGFLRITGRVKDLFKTSKAKYVAPTPIELKLAKNANVEQVCVVGTGIPQPIALVVPSDSARKLDKKALSASLAETLKEVNPGLEHHERLQNIVVLDEPWTPENGMLTPTLKIKRNEVDKRFGERYEAWYGGGKGVLFA